MKKEAKQKLETREITFLKPTNIEGIDHKEGEKLEVPESLAEQLINLGIAS